MRSLGESVPSPRSAIPMSRRALKCRRAAAYLALFQIGCGGSSEPQDHTTGGADASLTNLGSGGTSGTTGGGSPGTSGSLGGSGGGGSSAAGSGGDILTGTG